MKPQNHATTKSLDTLSSLHVKAAYSSNMTTSVQFSKDVSIPKGVFIMAKQIKKRQRVTIDELREEAVELSKAKQKKVRGGNLTLGAPAPTAPISASSNKTATTSSDKQIGGLFNLSEDGSNDPR
jgi:hypothetical protein